MSLSDDPLYRPPAAVASYWEASAGPAALRYPPLAGERRCDVAVVGAGYTGLGAALALAGYGYEVVVLEAGQPGWGASGRNGGFCGLGSSKLSLERIARRFGVDQARRYHAAQLEAIAGVAAFLDEHGVDAGRSGAGELALAHRSSRLAALDDERRRFEELLGWSSERLDRTGLAKLGVAGPRFHGGLLLPAGFGLHPLRFVRALAAAAAAAGAVIHGDSPVIGWRAGEGGHRLRTAQGTVRARHLVLAVNAHAPEQVFTPLRGTVLPAISAIMVTRPLDAAELAAQGWTSAIMAFDSRHLLHYFRLLPDGRFLFGGRGGIRATRVSFEARRRDLRRAFDQYFPAWRGVATEYFWRGFVCLAADRLPHVTVLDAERTVWTALAYHGGGVAMAPWCGRALAAVIAGRRSLESLPAPVRQPLPRFPLPALRRWALRAAYLGYRVADAL